jgi:DNA polymerase-3 subunit epsilon
MEYAVVDLETTGGDARNGRVIEVAIYIFDGEKLKDSYSTLVNPGVSIPAFITQLTGINEDMLVNAPTFEEVADKVEDFTKDRVFVAHNVGFDYSFLRNEFKKLDRRFIRKRLCTVRLSRKIFPGLRSYSLGKLCSQFDIPLENRHRAFGDARATTQLLKHLISSDLYGALEDSLKRYSREAILPPNMPREDYDDLPEEPGVYYFLDRTGKVIYVGKAKSLRDRVTSHFMDNEVKGKSRMFKSEIYNITYELCGNELVALLLESNEIKRLWPKYNWSQKRPSNNWALRAYEDQLGYMRFVLSKGRSIDPPIVTFNSFSEGWAYLGALVEEFSLCPKLAGIQKTSRACYNLESGKCKGACSGEEKPARYNKRMEKAINSIDDSGETFAIIGNGRTTEELSVVVMEQGKYLGFGYFQEDLQVNDVEDFKELVSPYSDNLDIQRLIRGYLFRNPKAKVLHFSAVEV